MGITDKKIRGIMPEVLFLKRVLNDYTALNRESITANIIGCLIFALIKNSESFIFFRFTTESTSCPPGLMKKIKKLISNNIEVHLKHLH